ncbi:glucokinase [Stutzerimonas tarimensis]|uniref:Glucokinase n=1 Tax=Stutzerimonas tarimensis TaxID=1507735 RepID=A0ABV7T8X3_9GAMM
MTLALVGDIGGTNARLALWRDSQLSAVRVLPTVDYATPADAIRTYLAGLNQPVEALDSVCLACAGPVQDDEFRFTNNHWRISRRAFSAELGLRHLQLVNDFAAMALGMTRLDLADRVVVAQGEADPDSPCLVIGPGTGLGVAGLLPLKGGGWRALPGEGGHVCVPVGSAREAALWQYLSQQVDHVEAESVLSGRGLLTLYRACCSLDGVEPVLQSPAEITGAALAGDAYAAGVLEQFCAWLGRIVGDNVLTLGARGGVYIVGGVIPRFVDFFLASGFLDAFRDKGRMSRFLEAVPVWLVTADYPGLTGAGVALEQLLEDG